jgi:hypothetical protein
MMPVLNSIASSVTTGTKYLKSDGTLTATETDRSTWLPRANGREPIRLQGAATGGSTAVTVEQGYGPEFGRDSAGAAVNPWAVLAESQNVFADLPAGAVVDSRFPFYRVKVVQSGSSATAAFLSATG